MKKRNWKVLVICLVAVYLTAFIGGLFTSQNTDRSWYLAIKPSITPPNWVFPVVWNVLFFLIALSLYFVWLSSKKQNKKEIIWVFGVNLVLNVVWSFLFFFLKNPAAALVDLVLLWVSILLMIYVCYGINKKSAYLLLPYFFWVSFAGVLNYLIVV